MFLIYVFFFFQAEDGIRDHCVTGVQTCALPIWRERMTFVVAGGGFAGVETVAELNDFVRGAVRYYPRVRPEEIRVVLVHSGPRILPEVSESLSEYALKKLRSQGVEVRLGTRIAGATEDRVPPKEGGQIPNQQL